MRLANDNDCCTEAIEILSDIWENVHQNSYRKHLLPLETFNKIGAFLADKGVIDSDFEPFDGYRQTNDCPNYLRS